MLDAKVGEVFLDQVVRSSIQLPLDQEVSPACKKVMRAVEMAAMPLEATMPASVPSSAATIRPSS